MKNNISWKIGEEFKNELAEIAHFETSGVIYEDIQSAARRLNAARAQSHALQVHLVCSEMFTAFTTYGRNIYISRKLAQLCRNKDMLAMIIAHEMAHHDLGHIPQIESQKGNSKIATLQLVGRSFLRKIEWFFFGPDREMEADAYALELCIQAGFVGYKCLDAFDILKKHALDMGAIEAVYGADVTLKAGIEKISWQDRILAWLSPRISGYYSVETRLKNLRRRIKPQYHPQSLHPSVE